MKIPASPPPLSLDVFEGAMDRWLDAALRVNASEDPYLPWERFRFHTPPHGLTPTQWWVATALQRKGQRRKLPLTDLNGDSFSYALPDEVLRLATQVAAKAGGKIGMAEPVTNPATRETYVVRSLMEESITSSQLEGAATTRRVAKEMLRTGREPRDKSEQMIWNNYQAMQFVLSHQGEPITPGLVRELHSIVTFNTLDDPANAGRLQDSGDARVYVATPDGDTLHTPPPVDELPSRLQALCAFANATDGGGPWLHPILRAIAIHFMIGHDHYFVDGNGRLARAVFYWSMLNQGLWLSEFITISTIIKRAPVQYAHAYLNTEYESDLTYFFIYHLRVLDRAFDELNDYLEAKVRQQQTVRSLLSERHTEFNHRQLAVVDRALSDPAAEFTVASHANTHHVTGVTARADLLALAEAGILTRHKRGKAFVWRPAPHAHATLGVGAATNS
ncbi:MAG: Fic family protein [Propioniciclava sp.]|uniref:Fic family protein n=1 Tax=Propioniciclava sp. TaxID=2038686 RepID=UPI0039E68489